MFTLKSRTNFCKISSLAPKEVGEGWTAMIIETSDEAVTQILTAIRQVMKNPLYIKYRGFWVKRDPMKKQIYFLLALLITLFIVHGWLTYDLATSISFKSNNLNNSILTKICWIFLSSSMIVRVLSNLKGLSLYNLHYERNK